MDGKISVNHYDYVRENNVRGSLEKISLFQYGGFVTKVEGLVDHL